MSISNILLSLGYTSLEQVQQSAGIIREEPSAPPEPSAKKAKKEKAPPSNTPPQTRGRRAKRRRIPRENGDTTPHAESVPQEPISPEAVTPNKVIRLQVTGRCYVPLIRVATPNITANLGPGEYNAEEQKIDGKVWLVLKSGYGNTLASIKKLTEEPSEALGGTVKIKYPSSATT